MKAVSRIQARVGGVSFDIPAGREVPPELAEFLALNGGGSMMKNDAPTYSTDNATVATAKKGKKD